jgi:Tfp pilus assembly protein PilZ
MIWLMTMFVFTLAFFLIFFTVYFFRPRKDDRILANNPENEPTDPEDIVLPHRAQPRWPATIMTKSGTSKEVTIASITHGNCFIESDLELPIGEKFQLNIELNDRTPLQLRAEVTWSNLHLPEDKVINRGFGVRFIEAGEDAICLINDTLSNHANNIKAGE